MSMTKEYQALKEFLNKVPATLLTAAEEIELARTIQANTIDAAKGILTPVGQRARDKLVRHNIKWVVKVAQKYQGMPLRDLVQIGCIGLARAAEKYDPAIGCRFSTYSNWWIRQAITRSLQNQGRAVRVPTHVHIKFSQIKKTRWALTQELQREPTEREVAQALKIPLEKVRFIAGSLAPVTSLDQLVGDDKKIDLGTLLASTEDTTLQAVEQAETVARVHEFLENLSERERTVLCYRYGIDCLPKKLDEIAVLLSLSKQRVQQLETKAMRTLQAIAKFQKTA